MAEGSKRGKAGAAGRTETRALFTSFARHLRERHGAIGEHMCSMLLPGVREFFAGQDITGFGPGNLEELLDAVGAGGGDAEDIMLFQLLVDLCDFCAGRGMDLSAVKERLLLEKTQILLAWQEDAFEDESDEEDLPDDLDAEDLLKNFDRYYPLIAPPAVKKPDSQNIAKMAGLIERAHDQMKLVYDKSLRIREGNPGITEADYLRLLERECTGSGKEPPEVSFEELRDMSFALPKEQLRKWIEIGIRMKDTEHLAPGTAERREAIEHLLADMRGLAADLRKIK